MSPTLTKKTAASPLSGEDKIVDLLRRRFAATDPKVREGIGDDAAVLRIPGAAEDWVVTTDMLVEGVDFLPGWQSPFQLGWKSLAVNLSDLAAMGARPRFYTVSLALPCEVQVRWISSFYRGLAAAGGVSGAVLIGGDLSRSPQGIQVSITAIGETAERRCLRRSGGHPGDWIYVTGVLGRSAAGLALLQSGIRKGTSRAEKAALEAFRRPHPRCEVGQWLAVTGWARAMMDLSDGLSTDLARLCRASGCGALLSANRIPVFPASAAWKCQPLSLALHGGEDFELLFGVSPRHAGRLEKNWPRRFPPVSRIGELTSTSGLVEIMEENGRLVSLQSGGFDHFRHPF